MHANFSTEINNLGTKGQSIGVTCRAVALRGGGFALFAGCFVPQNSPPHPKTRHICPSFHPYQRLAPRARFIRAWGNAPGTARTGEQALKARIKARVSPSNPHILLVAREHVDGLPRR